MAGLRLAAREAFYQGMPVSWWAQDIEENYQPGDPPMESMILSGSSTWYVDTPPSLWNMIQNRFASATTAVPVRDITLNAPLLSGDSAAIPVLQVLIRNNSAKVRRVAIAGFETQSQGIPQIVAALQEVSKDPDEQVQLDAANALLLVQFRELVTNNVKRDR